MNLRSSENHARDLLFKCDGIENVQQICNGRKPEDRLILQLSSGERIVISAERLRLEVWDPRVIRTAVGSGSSVGY